MFSRESGTKPSFVTVTGWRVDQSYIYAYTYIYIGGFFSSAGHFLLGKL